MCPRRSLHTFVFTGHRLENVYIYDLNPTIAVVALFLVFEECNWPDNHMQNTPTYKNRCSTGDTNILG